LISAKIIIFKFDLSVFLLFLPEQCDLKSTGTRGNGGLWNDPNTGATDEFGFSGLPGGYFHPSAFWNMGNTANFWSATPGGPGWDHYWKLSYNDAQVHHHVEGSVFGFSVRCIRDEQRFF